MNNANLIYIKLLIGDDDININQSRAIEIQKAALNFYKGISHSPAFQTFAAPIILKRFEKLYDEVDGVINMPSWPDHSDPALQSWLTSLKSLNNNIDRVIGEIKRGRWHWINTYNF